MVYVFLLVVFRIAGKRSLAQITTFDFVLLLIIGEVTQQALVGEDFSITNAFILIATLLAMEVGLTKFKDRFKKFDKVLDDVPLIVVRDGRFLPERMNLVRVDENEILAAARLTQGLERVEDIKYAIVEQNGEISIIANKS